MNDKLLKRVDHNIKRVSDPTIKQLLMDIAEELRKEEVVCPADPQEVQVAMDPLAQAVAKDEGAIKELMEKAEGLARQVEELTEAGFSAIRSMFNSPKARFPSTVWANKEKGVVTSYVVKTAKHGPVRVVNPVCKDVTQVPTNATVDATKKEAPSNT